MDAAATQTDNTALARQLIGHFTDGETERWQALLHPEICSKPSIDGAPVLHGRDEVADWWSRFAGQDGDLEARTLDFEAVGDCVIIRGYLRQREGRLLSERQVFWLYEFRDGLAIRMESHPTRNTALAACS